MLVIPALLSFSVFFFNAPPTPELYPLSLHDALPISTQTRLGPRHDPVGAVHQSNRVGCDGRRTAVAGLWRLRQDRKSTRLNSSHLGISYAVFCLKKKKTTLTNVRSITQDPPTRQTDA